MVFNLKKSPRHSLDFPISYNVFSAKASVSAFYDDDVRVHHARREANT